MKGSATQLQAFTKGIRDMRGLTKGIRDMREGYKGHESTPGTGRTKTELYEDCAR